MANRRGRRGRRRRKSGSWFTRLSAGKKVGVCLGGVFLALAASGVIYVAAKLGKIDTKEIPQEDIIINAEAEEAGEGFTNVALFGVDSREGDLAEGTRTDCIIVGSLNNKTKEIKMASVYRDTLLDIKDGELQKCNAAYSFGGPEQAINMLNKNLDLDIQKYITVDFSVVAEVVDSLGGVEIDVKDEEVQYINEFIDETGAVAGKEVHYVEQGGVQNLDGVQATTYARIRSTAGGDFTRTERQRFVIEKMVDKLKSSNLATINDIVDKVLPTISTNFTTTEILSYAKDFAKYTLGDSTGFPIDKTTDTISGLGSIVIPVTLADNVQKLHEFLYGTTGYTASSAVQNISGSIVSRIGQREATDDETLNSQTYTTAPEDAAQESGNNYGGGGTGNYTPPSTPGGQGTENEGNGTIGGGSGGSGNGNGGGSGDGNSGNSGNTEQPDPGGDSGGTTPPTPDTPPEGGATE